MVLLRKLLRNKSGSTIVLLSFVFLALISMIIMAINIARSRTVESWAEVNGKLWGKAILSEYDRYLLDDYGIMAFQGNDCDVIKRLSVYSKYSFEDKLRIRRDVPSANLDEYRMSDLDNFRKSLRNAMTTEEAKSIVDGKNRSVRKNSYSFGNNKTEYGNRAIGNQVVIDTLPSRGYKNHINIKGLTGLLSDSNAADKVKPDVLSKVSEMSFIVSKLNSHLKTVGDKETFFANEYEYIVKGSLDDNKNFEACKRELFAIRNALNLAALSKDPEKMKIITAISELIAPGPGAIVVQGAIMESWAALETHEDLKALLDNKRIPLMKKKGDWKISVEGVLRDSHLTDKLGDEARKLLNENAEQIHDLSKQEGCSEKLEGQNYEDYLLFMMLTIPKDLRTRRIMDLIQINMKYRYYDDFNFDEYNCGVRFNLKINGKSYEVNDSYK